MGPIDKTGLLGTAFVTVKTMAFQGLDLFHAFYFTFLSYAAVGLGDVMPVNYAVSRDLVK